MRVIFTGKKDVYERYLLPSNLANSKHQKIRNGASTLGVLCPFLGGVCC